MTTTEHDTRQRIWQELERAPHDRHHEWRTPVLATVGADGAPNARSVVLRHADAKQHTLQFYTDRRSPKARDLQQHPAAVLVFWSKRLNWQLRVRAQMRLQTAGPEVDAVWARVRRSPAAGDYLSQLATGAVLTDGSSAPQWDTHQPQSDSASQHHLAIVTAAVQHIDWLELGRSGHRRAVVGTDPDQWEWRVP